MQGLSRELRVGVILAVSSLSSVFLYLTGVVLYQDTWFWFLNWNLALAWLPLLFGWLLIRHVRQHSWLSWQGVLYSLLWLGFLPNSFYIASDFIHLRHATSATALYYAVLILSFCMSGFLLGYTSLYQIHRQLLKHLKTRQAHAVIGLVLLLCSFAIYLGRYLRWNTWDVLVNPAGILFDVSDRLINPSANGQLFRITMLFFVALGTVYYVLWMLLQTLQLPHPPASHKTDLLD